jgi:tetratricopeptide (TPR) repeat protein
MNLKAKSGPFVAIVALSLLASLVGCASVEKRYKKGQELEEKGRLEEAAQRYISVLAKEPGREDARERLADVGARVIDESLAQARADGAEGLYENAVAAIIRVDGLRDRSGQVGVALAVPDDYADFRRDMIDAAAETLFRQGEDLENAGDWAEASRRYDKLRSYPLTSDQAFKVDGSRARVLLRWAERDMELGAFRAAYTRAQAALDIFGADSETGMNGRAIQTAALNAGTKTVAVLPFWADPGAGAGAPRGIENDLYDSLLYERMDSPPLFVGPIDRGAVHREMSRLRVRSGEIPIQTALMVGRALNADFVVVGWLESYEQEDGTPQEIAKKAPLRRDKSTSVSYTEKRYTARLTGEATYRIIDAATGRAVEEETVGTHATAAFRRAYFDGDYATLDLSREERALFNKEEWLRAEEELRASLVDKLAERIASGVFDRVLRHVR